MKLALFNLREDERPFVDAWLKEHPDVEVDLHEGELQLETKHLIDGKQGIVMFQNRPFAKEVYDYAKEQGVKVIANRMAGFDIHDIKYMRELGISMTNVPRYSPNAIAEHVVTTVLYISRNIKKILNNVEKHDFTWNKNIISRELRTLTVGVLGTGNIGRQSATLFKGLGCRVIGYDLYPSDAAREVLEYVDSIDELLAQSDVVTIHVPATKEYTHMVNDEFFSKMKDGAIFANAARGVLVDTKAVIRALDSGKLLGASLDVYENEGNYVPKDFSNKEFDDKVMQELIDRDDIIYTPHTAFYTETAVKNLVEGALNAATEVISSGDSPNAVKR